ncbi:MAG: transposase [Candidatus Eremiobacteraeota bacterium]|nr:transposase [Candidatus Eremiobacteraeota bacterium]
MSKVSRLEVIETGARRRWSVEEKLRILAESEHGPRQVSATARRYGLSTGQLFTWRRLARQGRLCAAEPMTFAPVVVSRDEAANRAPSPARDTVPMMELVLRNGRLLRLPESVTPARAAALAEALERIAQ